MEKDLYNNNESEFSEVIGFLKNLPKIDAPENFEFNLNTRIQNGNFTLSQKEQVPKWLTWGLGPVAALTLSAIVFFFVISDSGLQTENLLMQNPELRQSVNVVENSGDVNASKTVSEKNEMSERNSNKLKAIIEPNDVVIAKRTDFPFNNSNSIDLDAYINGNKGTSQNGGNIKTVSSGPASVGFNGFGIPVKISPSKLAAMRNRIDSLNAKNSAK